ncbi:recombinase family protein [Mesorhizobium sp. M1004]|uniref:recombinase family protein n=1 Tax=Mesorhizobium sp. M1004 TaxID=2957046 RepID=UPI0033367261
MALATQLTITETPRSRISCGSAACVLKKQGWTVVHSNTHRAICGASLLRPGLQELISDAMQGKFLIVLAEAMDRLTMTAANREQARLGKRCNRSFKEIHRLLATSARCEW